MMYQIYLIKNMINGKMYVGKTSRTLPTRWQTHLRASRKKTNRPLYSAFRKYGVNSFSIEPVDVASSNEEANTLERLWIFLLDSGNRNLGYNLTKGGDGGDTFSGRKHKEETKTKMALAALGRVVGEEAKRKLRLRNGRRQGESAFRFNRTVSTEEVIQWYAEGLSTRQIASKFGMEKTAIIGRLKKSGVTLRPNCRDWKKAA